MRSESPAAPMAEESTFRFWPFFLVLIGVLALTTTLNWLVDPLWYVHGNLLTGRNFPFNERIAKLNLLRRTGAASYDCLILGSSRVTGVRSDAFTGQHCFNLALKGAQGPEMLAYARYAKALGMAPKSLYVGVDEFDFVLDTDTERHAVPHVEATPDFYHAFVSIDVLTFSLMTLAGISPDPLDIYDRSFEPERVHWMTFTPEMQKKRHIACRPQTVQSFDEIRQLFPEAKATAYATPMVPWYQLSDVYSRGVLDCVLDAYHAVARHYDAFEDFAIPSSLTMDLSQTHDGVHFSPQANRLVVDELQGRRSDLALDVKSMDLVTYRRTVHERLKTFARDENLMSFWND